MEMSTYCMKNKKYRKPVLILTVLFCVSLTGCTKIYNGTDELTEKARKEMPSYRSNPSFVPNHIKPCLS